MSGYCLLNSAISRSATLLSGVQLHQLTVPEVAEPPSSELPPPESPPPQAVSARIAVAATTRLRVIRDGIRTINLLGLRAHRWGLIGGVIGDA